MLRELLAWADQADALRPSIDLLGVATGGRSFQWDQAAERLEQAAAELHADLSRITSIAKLDLTVAVNYPDWNQVSIQDVSDRTGLWRSELGRINDWVAAREAFEAARGFGAQAIVHGLIDGTITPAEARPILDLLIAEALWHKARIDDPRLDEIDGAERTLTAKNFRDLDRRRIAFARYEVLAGYLGQRPQGATGEMATIRDEIGKKRRHLPIRKLMERAGIR